MQPNKALKRYLQRSPRLASIGKCLRALFAGPRRTAESDLRDLFPGYAPSSPGGGPAAQTALTIAAINESPMALVELARLGGGRETVVETAEEFGARSRAAAYKLKLHFDKFGSNKATLHNYHFIYGAILAAPDEVKDVLEIGIGSTDASIPGHMGAGGIPGASLRAFRGYLKNARIFGADIDRRILIQEDRIASFHVDQQDWASLEALGRRLPPALDLIVDDGLHSPHANLHTLRFALGRIRAGGWIVIEDIKPEAKPLWQVVAALLSERYETHLIDARLAAVFLVRRRD